MKKFNVTNVQESRPRESLIIKLGGSVITKKYTENFPFQYKEIKQSQSKFIRKSVIKRLIYEIYQSYKKKHFDFILINGAGPFGHRLVHEYLQNKKIGISTIHKSVNLLNSVIGKEMEKYFSVTTVSPMESCYYKNGKFNMSNMEKTVRKNLKENKVVSTYGDIIPAKNGRLGEFEVISGDDIAVSLARKLMINKIIMVSDVDGIFTKNPQIHKDAKLIKNYNLNSNDAYFTLTKTDVSGGMETKVKKLLVAAKNGIESNIVNGLKAKNLYNVLLGKCLGTKINNV